MSFMVFLLITAKNQSKQVQLLLSHFHDFLFFFVCSSFSTVILMKFLDWKTNPISPGLPVSVEFLSQQYKPPGWIRWQLEAGWQK